jgi:hypothetical protein
MDHRQQQTLEARPNISRKMQYGRWWKEREHGDSVASMHVGYQQYRMKNDRSLGKGYTRAGDEK